MIRIAAASLLIAVTAALGFASVAPGDASSPGVPGKIAFSSGRDGDDGDIFVMNPDGSGVQQLTKNADIEGQPVWSPDGTRLVYYRVTGGQADLYVMNADGTNQRRVTTSPAHDASATWSPDGQRLVFDSDRGGNYDVYVINADGTGEFNLTNAPGSEESFPSWSPDGQWILFESAPMGADADLYRMPAGGGAWIRVTSVPGNDWQSDWSPDGRRIVFTVYDGSQNDVWVVNADGTSPQRLTNSPDNDGGAAWTADGSAILFMSARSGGTDIYTMKPDGAGQTKLTSSAAFDGWPDSQPIGCTVAAVVDGDTFTCADGKTIRMLAIDALPAGTCGGDWAKAALGNIFLTPGRQVRLQFDVTRQDGTGAYLAAPLWIGNDGAVYNLSIVMVYVGLARSATVGAGNTGLQAWANSSEAWAAAAQWNMWAPGKPYNGGGC